MARRVIAWQCKYCGALKKSEGIAVRHEKSCLRNKEGKNCLHCEHRVGQECDKRSIRCSSAVSADCSYYTPETPETVDKRVNLTRISISRDFLVD